MTASDSPSYHRTHPERDLISEAIASERRERRLRIVEALAPQFAAACEKFPSETLPKVAKFHRAIVDALESIVEPTEGQPQ